MTVCLSVDLLVLKIKYPDIFRNFQMSLFLHDILRQY